ncbi:MAG TPA: lipase secretion chaperone [Leptospiraceae bacterium]|nr:lipase secretion chaperone [Leptospiraceae bacterium]HMZ60481.1 lipase secretion chaperone [Leptospiraceae bacterium]HNF16930.1 lipase secretion chaperone [Leptospiraceae bacterium]HNF23099.1 lipase secretion chaperone [Leptospiraceae bacterium]HNI97948.1 lipase secretion chaperone [Leptospiraceae bacterium]
MESKKLYIILGAAGLLLILALLLFPSEKKGSGKKKKSEYTVESQSSASDEVPSMLKDQAMSMFQNDDLLSYDELMEGMRNGKIDIVGELWAFRRKCPTDFTYEQCNEMIRTFLLSNYPAPHNKELAAMFEKYLKYEFELRSFKQDPNLKFEDRYEQIKKKRRDIFKDEEARLIFGLEEAKVNFLQANSSFLQSSKNLSGEDRIKAYEKMREQVYGPYYKTVTEREPKFTKYETEVSLRENDFRKLSDSEKTAKLESVQEKYFGKDGVERIRKVKAELEEENKRISIFQEKEKKFLSANSSLNEKEKLEKLDKLRLEVFGSQEAADSYRRQQEFIEYLKGEEARLKKKGK